MRRKIPSIEALIAFEAAARHLSFTRSGDELALTQSAIGRQIAGISQKMLTQTLRELERDGLVTRTVTLAVPVRVDYQLTTLGQDLQAVVRPLKIWAEHNMDRILEHRARAT